MDNRTMLLMMVVPTAVAFIVMLVGWRAWKRTPVDDSTTPDGDADRERARIDRWGLAAGAVAVGGAYAAQSVVIEAWPALSGLDISRNSLEFLPVAVLGAAIVFAVLAALRAHWSIRWVLELALPTLAIWLMVSPRASADGEFFTRADALWWTALGGVASFVLTRVLAPLADDRRATSLAIPLAGVLTIGAMVVTFDGVVAKNGQLIGALSAAVGVVIPLALWSRTARLGHAGAATLSLALILTLAHTPLFGYPKDGAIWTMAAIPIALLGLWGGIIIPRRSTKEASGGGAIASETKRAIALVIARSILPIAIASVAMGYTFDRLTQSDIAGYGIDLPEGLSKLLFGEVETESDEISW